MSRESNAAPLDDRVIEPNLWPRCYDCGIPRPLLFSYVARGESMGRARCEACLAAAMRASEEA
jgi:hypothetical protein